MTLYIFLGCCTRFLGHCMGPSGFPWEWNGNVDGNGNDVAYWSLDQRSYSMLGQVVPGWLTIFGSSTQPPIVGGTAGVRPGYYVWGA